MTDESALFAAICANREDDTVRLAYADHLDELGGEVNQAHAEYIRIQIRHHSLPGEDWDSARESYLYRTYAARWQHSVPGFTISLNSRRGFPCRATAPASAVLAAADNPFGTLFDEFVLIADVVERELLEVFRGPLVAGLRSLQIGATREWVGSLRLGSLAAISLPRLERLILNGLWLTDTDVRQLCSATDFPRLVDLDLGYNQITDAGADALSSSPLASRLRRLCLANNSIGPDAAVRLSNRFGTVLVGGLP